jgi:pyruvate/2-oxoglutarate dehydrogenase complex dihydrolipoamide dehydrogenase (E3) component
MERLGVKVELDKKVSPEAVLGEEADVVVIASGATPIIPDIPGVERCEVITAIDALSADTLPGEEVVMIGGGLIGCETAEYLTTRNKKVTIVEMLENVATDVGISTRWVLLRRLREQGIRMLTSTTVKSITNSGVVIEREGKTKTLKADLVILAVGLKPQKELAESLSRHEPPMVPRLYTIGDCSEVGKILEAIHDGFRIGCEL